MIGYKSKRTFSGKKILWLVLVVFFLFITWYFFLYQPPNVGDWQAKVAVLPTVEFKGDLATVHNVRNFQYPDKETNPVIAYYDKTYDLSKVSKVWFITEPFKPEANVAHTFLSFEFSNNDFLAITIEARLQKDQVYNVYKGMLRTYPLMYIAADEKDAILLRANVRKSNVYLYPVNATPEQARTLLTDMLEKMNDLAQKPAWYNAFFANCTSRIAYHVDKIWPDTLSTLSWQLWLTGHADELAFKKGLIASDLSISEARKRYLITEKSQKTGRVPNYSELIRK